MGNGVTVQIQLNSCAGSKGNVLAQVVIDVCTQLYILTCLQVALKLLSGSHQSFALGNSIERIAALDRGSYLVACGHKSGGILGEGTADDLSSLCPEDILSAGAGEGTAFDIQHGIAIGSLGVHTEHTGAGAGDRAGACCAAVLNGQGRRTNRGRTASIQIHKTVCAGVGNGVAVQIQFNRCSGRKGQDLGQVISDVSDQLYIIASFHIGLQLNCAVHLNRAGDGCCCAFYNAVPDLAVFVDVQSDTMTIGDAEVGGICVEEAAGDLGLQAGIVDHTGAAVAECAALDVNAAGTTCSLIPNDEAVGCSRGNSLIDHLKCTVFNGQDAVGNTEHSTVVLIGMDNLMGDLAVTGNGQIAGSKDLDELIVIAVGDIGKGLAVQVKGLHSADVDDVVNYHSTVNSYGLRREDNVVSQLNTTAGLQSLDQFLSVCDNGSCHAQVDLTIFQRAVAFCLLKGSSIGLGQRSFGSAHSNKAASGLLDPNFSILGQCTQDGNKAVSTQVQASVALGSSDLGIADNGDIGEDHAHLGLGIHTAIDMAALHVEHTIIGIAVKIDNCNVAVNCCGRVHIIAILGKAILDFAACDQQSTADIEVAAHVHGLTAGDKATGHCEGSVTILVAAADIDTTAIAAHSSVLTAKDLAAVHYDNGLLAHVDITTASLCDAVLHGHTGHFKSSCVTNVDIAAKDSAAVLDGTTGNVALCILTNQNQVAAIGVAGSDCLGQFAIDNNIDLLGHVRSLTTGKSATGHVKDTFSEECTATTAKEGNALGIIGIIILIIYGLCCTADDGTAVDIDGRIGSAMDGSTVLVVYHLGSIISAAVNGQSMGLCGFAQPEQQTFIDGRLGRNRNALTGLILAGVGQSNVDGHFCCVQRVNTLIVLTGNGLTVQVKGKGGLIGDTHLATQSNIVYQVVVTVGSGQVILTGPCAPAKDLAVTLAEVLAVVGAAEASQTACKEALLVVGNGNALVVHMEILLIGFCGLGGEVTGCGNIDLSALFHLADIDGIAGADKQVCIACFCAADLGSAGDVNIIGIIVGVHQVHMALDVTAADVDVLAVDNKDVGPVSQVFIAVSIHAVAVLNGTGSHVELAVDDHITAAVGGLTAGNGAAVHVEGGVCGHINAAAVLTGLRRCAAGDLCVAAHIEGSACVDKHICAAAMGRAVLDLAAGHVEGAVTGNINVAAETVVIRIGITEVVGLCLTLLDQAAIHIEDAVNIDIAAHAALKALGILLIGSSDGSAGDLAAVHIEHRVLGYADSSTVVDTVDIGSIQGAAEEFEHTETDPNASALVDQHHGLAGLQSTGLLFAVVHNSKVCALIVQGEDTVIFLAVNGIAIQVDDDLGIGLQRGLSLGLDVAVQEIVTAFCSRQNGDLFPHGPLDLLLTVVTVAHTGVAQILTGNNKNMRNNILIVQNRKEIVLFTQLCKAANGRGLTADIVYNGIAVRLQLKLSFAGNGLGCADDIFADRCNIYLAAAAGIAAGEVLDFLHTGNYAVFDHKTHHIQRVHFLGHICAVCLTGNRLAAISKSEAIGAILIRLAVLALFQIPVQQVAALRNTLVIVADKLAQ